MKLFKCSSGEKNIGGDVSGKKRFMHPRPMSSYDINGMLPFKTWVHHYLIKHLDTYLGDRTGMYNDVLVNVECINLLMHTNRACQAPALAFISTLSRLQTSRYWYCSALEGLYLDIEIQITSLARYSWLNMISTCWGPTRSSSTHAHCFLSSTC